MSKYRIDEIVAVSNHGVQIPARIVAIEEKWITVEFAASSCQTVHENHLNWAPQWMQDEYDRMIAAR